MDAEDAGRPDPEELLRQMRKRERRAAAGCLTVFVGAAPGVGKTWAMLEAAREALGRGSVLIGVVETHGRAETAALADAFETIPRRTVEYRGIRLGEFDLDAALARHPSLLLVDELAHTNAPGSRHPKRWMDVQELLDAGIDVYTTVNIQHLDSLNDIVARVTHVTVQETVPDALFDRADEIRVVDLPPDRLLDRLREGKVYLPDQAERAAERFFRKGNLIALRELLLRRTAERVEAQMREFRRQSGVEKTWSASDRILVCVGPSPFSANLVRAASRMARSLHVTWIAVHVETPDTVRLSRTDRARLATHLRLAERLGAETVIAHGNRTAEALLRVARDRGITKIIVGKPRYVRLRDRLRGSFVDEIIRGSGDIDVYATSGDSGEASVVPPPAAMPRKAAWQYAAAVGIVALATGVNAAVFGHENVSDVVMLFLLGVVVAALRLDSGPSLTAALLSAIAFDFFFTPPYFTFAMADARHVVTFVVMIGVAFIIGRLGLRVRGQAEAARARERQTDLLYSVTRDLARTSGLEALTAVAAARVREVFDARVTIWGPGPDGAIRVLHRTDPGVEPGSAEEDEAGIAAWVLTNQRDAGLGTDTLASSRTLFLPLVAPGGSAGVLGLRPADPRTFQDTGQRRILDALIPQIATALERARLAYENERSRVEGERERLRNVLLSSVSHDLRTPLAAIKGSASALKGEFSRDLAAGALELVQAIEDEADRLTRRVRDLLDMTRLESGSFHLQEEWQPLEEVVGAALNHMEHALAGREIEVDLPAELPPVRIDGPAIEQVLLNLLENAVKYSEPGTPIGIRARLRDGPVEVEVSDRGPGLPAGQEARLFDKFFRVDERGRAGGVGLGLAVCKALVELHGGRISAVNRPDGGSVFRFSLPSGTPPETTDAPGLEDAPEAALQGGPSP